MTLPAAESFTVEYVENKPWSGYNWYQGGYRTQVDPGSLVPYRQWVAQAVARYAGNPSIAFWQLVNERARKPSRRPIAIGQGLKELILKVFARWA